jgi:cell division protein FtsX
VAWLNAELSALTSSYAYEIKIGFVDLSTASWIVLGVALLGVTGAWLSVSRELRRFSARA